MSESRINKKDIVNVVYRLMYVIPISMAIIAECWVWVGSLLKKDSTLSGMIAAQGGIYTAVVLVSMLAAVFISLPVTLSRWTKVASGALIFIALIVLMFLKIRPERLTVAALLWLVPVLLADIIRDFAKKDGESKVVFLLPFLLISFLMVEFLPISDKPLDWSGVIGVYERIAESTKEFWGKFNWGGGEYGTADIGFDGNSTLFKKMKSNSDTVMEVHREYPTAGALYLTGKIYSDFSGKNWTSYVPAEGEAEYSRMMDTIETRSCFEETYPNNLRDVYSGEKIDIRIKSIRSPYAFLPSKMVVGSKNSIAVKYEGDNVLFDDTKTYGYEYSVYYYMLNRNGEDLIKYHREISEEKWKEASYNLKPNGVKSYSYEEYLGYKERIKDVYGNAPELSDEAAALIDEITAGADSDYDKLCKIEEWLASHIYTLNVDNRVRGIKSESDFLDYFLLDNTEGYCSYYATAFVLMARAEGIPARYVQGYRVPSSRRKDITVTSSMAHAWAEAYFEGVGWIRFEPTPGFGSVPSWGEPLETPDFYDDLIDAGTEENAEEEISEEIKEEVPFYDNSKKLEEEARRMEEAIKRQQMIILTVIATVAGLLLIGSVFVLIRLIIRSVRYRRKSDAEKTIEMCLRCMLVLDSIGKKPEHGETLSEFSARVSEELKFDNMLFVDTYEHVLYKGVSDEKVALLEENHKQIKKLLRRRKMGKARLSYAIGVIFDRKVLSE